MGWYIKLIGPREIVWYNYTRTMFMLHLCLLVFTIYNVSAFDLISSKSHY